MTRNQDQYSGPGQQPPYSGYNQSPYPPQGQYPPPQWPPAPYPSSFSPQYGHPPGPPNPQQSPPTYGAAASYYGVPPPLSPEALSTKPVEPNAAPPIPPHPSEEERGILGALAGGAAGGYAGHKMHHGIIGTVGGAYAGHKLEDAWKHHHQEGQKPIPPPTGPPPPYVDHASKPVEMRGNFSASSGRMSLDKDFDLIAECRGIDGRGQMSSIALNRHLGNDDGKFVWVGEGGNFGASARNVRLIEEGRVLEAELRAVDGSWRWDRVRLDERLGNNDGELVFVN